MRHIRIYEQFDMAAAPEMIEAPELGTGSHFEAETTEFRPTTDEEEGEYVVNFTNHDGEETTINIRFANEPEYVGNTMISSIDMVEDSSSDGKPYSVIGYYDEVTGTGGAYELKKVLIEEV
jgi:hypothetical protein